jgi:hypothetical protein
MFLVGGRDLVLDACGYTMKKTPIINIARMSRSSFRAMLYLSRPRRLANVSASLVRCVMRQPAQLP